MKRRFFISLFIAISNGCAPSVPSQDPVITTTTIASTTRLSTTTANSTVTNTTTIPTINSTSAATTTTIPTTTPTTTTPRPRCCSWPFPRQSVNNVAPEFDEWGGCNGTLTITCQISDPISGTYTEVSVLGDYTNVPQNQLESRKIISNSEQVVVAFTCNEDTQQWIDNVSSGSSTSITCGYKTPAGNTVAAM